MLRNNIRDRSTIKLLNDRQNFIKLVKSREFNLERQKELKKYYKNKIKNYLIYKIKK